MTVGYDARRSREAAMLEGIRVRVGGMVAQEWSLGSSLHDAVGSQDNPPDVRRPGVMHRWLGWRV